MMQVQREKDYKSLHGNKKMYERQISELKAEIESMKGLIGEKDKDLKAQAIQLRELIHDEFRKDTIKKNYAELERLTQSPRSMNNSRLDQKLEQRNMVLLKYGRLPLKPGFNKKKLDYNDKLVLLDI